MKSNHAHDNYADVVQYKAKLNISEIGVGIELDQVQLT